MPIVHMSRRLAAVTLLMVVAVARSPTTQTVPDILDHAAAQALTDFARVCGPEGQRLWAMSLCGPMAIIDARTRAAVANHRDPAGTFLPRNGVFEGSFPRRFEIANTSIDWDGERWATVAGPLPADPFTRLKLVVHESFHRVQAAANLGGSDRPSDHLETEAGRLWMRLELRALGRALRAEGPTARRSTRDAVLFRLNRYRLFPGAEDLEASMERQEGLAEYTGTVVALRSVGEHIDRVAREIESFEDSNAYARSFAYRTGPALGLLLDRYAADWRQRIRTSSMHRQLMAALAFHAPADVEGAAKLRASDYGLAAVEASEDERANRQNQFLANLKRRFVDGQTLRFPQVPNLARTFNPNALVPFGEYGTYYPTGTFTATWGRLQVDSGGAVVSRDNMSLRTTSPSVPDGRPVLGDGWSLELAPGWTIRRAIGADFYEVIQEPK